MWITRRHRLATSMSVTPVTSSCYSVAMDGRTRSQIEDFFNSFPRRQAAKGQIIIQAHENPGFIYHLIDGRVKQYDISYRGDEVVLNTFKPPAFFPMSFAINRTPNLYTYQAETDLAYHLAPIPDTLAFLKSHPDVLFDLLARVYSGTDGLLGRLAHLMAGSARSRVLYELLIECRRFGDRRGRGVLIAITESDIAARAGLARETVSRELGRLKGEQVVSIIKQEILINELEKLASLVSAEL
jgi:CRP/FNR family cyclic AMP-dependent transcriptional regulator